MEEKTNPPLKEKNPAAVALGRLGGLVRGRKGTATLPYPQKIARAKAAGKALWADMTPEERSAEMKRRMANAVANRTVRGPYGKKSESK